MLSASSMEPEETQIQGSFFNKVDVPDHVHYTVVVFVFVIGTLGIMVNALVIFAFYRLLHPRSPDDILYMGICHIHLVQQELHHDALLFCFLHSNGNYLVLLHPNVSSCKEDWKEGGTSGYAASSSRNPSIVRGNWQRLPSLPLWFMFSPGRRTLALH